MSKMMGSLRPCRVAWRARLQWGGALKLLDAGFWCGSVSPRLSGQAKDQSQYEVEASWANLSKALCYLPRNLAR